MKKTWQEKLNDSKDLPKVVEPILKNHWLVVKWWYGLS